MRRIFSSNRDGLLVKVGIFVITAILIAGMAGCGGDGYTPPSKDLEIWNWYDLNLVRYNLDGDRILMKDLDSSSVGYTELASPTAHDGKGWDPIGSGYWASGPLGPMLVGEVFMGSFDGQGYEIRDLFINRDSGGGIGLFGCVGRNGIIKNLGVSNTTVTVPEAIYILDVATIAAVGMLAGFNKGSVSDSYASGTVIGDENVGGLVGQNTGTVDNSYSTGNVTRGGGLVGSNGGLIYSGTISNSYSTVCVTRGGGLVDRNEASGPGVRFCGTVSNSFWDTETSGQFYSDGGTGKNTTEMQNITTFSEIGWNITAVSNTTMREPSYIWNIVNNVTYPFLSWQS